jgi:phosphoribosylamine---glycine ligase
VVLPRLRTPLSELLLAAATGGLGRMPYPVFADDAAVVVVLASAGYPDAPETGRAITGLDAAAAVPGVTIAHAATAEVDGGFVATGGRVLGVVGTGGDLTAARDAAYAGMRAIHLEGGQYRTDIAAAAAEEATP